MSGESCLAAGFRIEQVDLDARSSSSPDIKSGGLPKAARAIRDRFSRLEMSSLLVRLRGSSCSSETDLTLPADPDGQGRRSCGRSCSTRARSFGSIRGIAHASGDRRSELQPTTRPRPVYISPISAWEVGILLRETACVSSSRPNDGFRSCSGFQISSRRHVS